MNDFPDPQIKQICGARDLMNEDYLMTVLTRENLIHGEKTYLN